MGSPAKKLAIRFLAWVSGLVLASALFSLVGISLLVDFVRRLAHWGAPTEEEAQRQQAEDASRWWASLLARAGGNPSAASDLCGPAPAEELARLVKEAPAIVLDGELSLQAGDWPADWSRGPLTGGRTREKMGRRN